MDAATATATATDDRIDTESFVERDLEKHANKEARGEKSKKRHKEKKEKKEKKKHKKDHSEVKLINQSIYAYYQLKEATDNTWRSPPLFFPAMLCFFCCLPARRKATKAGGDAQTSATKRA